MAEDRAHSVVEKKKKISFIFLFSNKQIRSKGFQHLPERLTTSSRFRTRRVTSSEK